MMFVSQIETVFSVLEEVLPCPIPLCQAHPARVLPRKMLSYRWLIFGVLSVAYLIIIFHRLSPAVMSSDLIFTFAIDGAALGLLGSMYFYPYALMQLPAGILSDSIGPRKLASVSFAVAGIGAVLFGLAPNFQVALLARLLIGLGLSCVYVPTLKIFSIWFRKNEYATIAGLLVSLGNIGGLIAATPLAIMIVRFGWRSAVTGIGLLTVMLAVAMFTVVRNSPQEMALPGLDEIDQVPPDQRIPLQPVPILQGVKTVSGNRYFWPVAIRSFTSYGVLMSFQSLWGGPYLMQVLGQNQVQAGSTLMMISIGSILTPPIGGYLSDKILGTRKGIVLFSAALSTLCWVPIALMPGRITPGFLYGWLFLLGASGGLGVSGLAMIKELFPVSLTGTVNGLNNFFTMAGGALYTVMVGLIIESYPKTAAGTFSIEAFSGGFRFLLISMVVGTILLLFAKETKGISQATLKN